METKWTSFVGPGFPFHLDPREKDIGEGGKNFALNPAEAKKLLSAAGVSTPVQAPWNTTTLGGPSALEGPEAMRGLIEASGDFKLEPVRVLQYFTDSCPRLKPHVATSMALLPAVRRATGLRLHHVCNPPPQLHRLLDEGRGSQDYPVRRPPAERTGQEQAAEILKEFQRYAATKMYYIPGPPGDWKTLAFTSPG